MIFTFCNCRAAMEEHHNPQSESRPESDLGASADFLALLACAQAEPGAIPGEPQRPAALPGDARLPGKAEVAECQTAPIIHGFGRTRPLSLRPSFCEIHFCASSSATSRSLVAHRPCTWKLLRPIPLMSTILSTGISGVQAIVAVQSMLSTV